METITRAVAATDDVINNTISITKHDLNCVQQRLSSIPENSKTAADMCGRYVLALRYDEVRQELQHLGISVHDCEYPAAAEEDQRQDDGLLPEAGNTPTGAASQATPHDEAPRRQAFHPSYNMAPRFHGIVLRGVSRSADPHFAVQLQVMQWGLIPSWTKRRPDYALTLKTINCRADSLSAGGMWSSIRGPKRCVVVAQGFYEWRQVGTKERVPHYIRRHDGRPLLFAGLWDAVSLNDDSAGIKTRRKREKIYTYTIITTDSNDDMRFLHTRMPVIFDAGSPALRMWLDPTRTEWSSALQSLLQPWPSKTSSDDASYLDIDVVGKDVNKVGHDSPSLIIPVASRENKANIANFFASGQKGKADSDPTLSGVAFPTNSTPSAVAGSKRSADGPYNDNTSKDAANDPALKRAKVQAGQSLNPDLWSPKKSPKVAAGKAHTKYLGKSKAGQEITSYFRPKE